MGSGEGEGGLNGSSMAKGSSRPAELAEIEAVDDRSERRREAEGSTVLSAPVLSTDATLKLKSAGDD